MFCGVVNCKSVVCLMIEIEMGITKTFGRNVLQLHTALLAHNANPFFPAKFIRRFEASSGACFLYRIKNS